MNIAIFNNIEFANPEFFFLLLLLPVLIYLQWFRKSSNRPAMRISSVGGLKTGISFKLILLRTMPVLRLLAFVALIVALARPQSSFTTQSVKGEGIDIILSTDLSGSMLAEDFQPNRIEAAKRVAIDFVNSRPHDRIGLVVFSGESFTLVPLTTNHPILINAIAGAVSGTLENGTAIGMGLATSVDRLKESNAKSKVIILLTDGVNNRGFIDPLTAAEIARQFNVRVYTIGIGTDEKVRVPMPGINNFTQVQIDENLMRKISGMTGGRYFRATDNNTLSKIYAEIDRLEKSKLESNTYNHRKEEYFPWALAAVILLAFEFLSRYTYLKTLT